MSFLCAELNEYEQECLRRKEKNAEVLEQLRLKEAAQETAAAFQAGAPETGTGVPCILFLLRMAECNFGSGPEVGVQSKRNLLDHDMTTLIMSR